MLRGTASMLSVPITRESKKPEPFHVPVSSLKLSSIVDVFPLIVEATLTLSQSLSASVTSKPRE